MASRAGRAVYLTRAGFLPAEVRKFAINTSREGMKAPYFQAMVRSRRALFRNAQRYDWSITRYKEEIKRLYIIRDAIRTDALGRRIADPWKMLRFFQEKFPAPDEYESPWRKRTQKRRKAKRQQKRTTRRAMLAQWIGDLERTISRTKSEKRRQQLESQKRGLEAQLSRLQ